MAKTGDKVDPKPTKLKRKTRQRIRGYGGSLRRIERKRIQLHKDLEVLDKLEARTNRKLDTLRKEAAS